VIPHAEGACLGAMPRRFLEATLHVSDWSHGGWNLEGSETGGLGSQAGGGGHQTEAQIERVIQRQGEDHKCVFAGARVGGARGLDVCLDVDPEGDGALWCVARMIRSSGALARRERSLCP
jgi:hypothetical protein